MNEDEPVDYPTAQEQADDELACFEWLKWAHLWTLCAQLLFFFFKARKFYNFAPLL